MALAVALLWWDRVLLFSSRRCDMPGPSPALRVLFAVNTPLFLPRAVWRNYLYKLYVWDNAVPWDNVVLIVAVGLCWSGVALNIRSWQQCRTVLMFSWRPARFLLDVFLVIYGVLFGLIGMFEGYKTVDAAPYAFHGNGCFGPNLWTNLLPSIAAASLYLAWSLVLIFFFGRDFIQALRKTRVPAVP
jgi:hypothetical protein